MSIICFEDTMVHNMGEGNLLIGGYGFTMKNTIVLASAPQVLNPYVQTLTARNKPAPWRSSIQGLCGDYDLGLGVSGFCSNNEESNGKEHGK